MKAHASTALRNTFIYFWLGILTGAVVVLATVMLNSITSQNTRADLLRGEYDYSYDTSRDYSSDYIYEEPTIYDERSYSTAIEGTTTLEGSDIYGYGTPPN